MFQISTFFRMVLIKFVRTFGWPHPNWRFGYADVGRQMTLTDCAPKRGFGESNRRNADGYCITYELYTLWHTNVTIEKFTT